MIRRTTLAAFLIVAWVYWIPLVVVMISGTWSPDVIESRARMLAPDCAAQLDNVEALDRKLEALEENIGKTTNEALPPLLELHSDLLQYRETIDRAKIVAYANSEVRHHFFASYLALALLIATQLRKLPEPPAKLHLLGIATGAACYVFFNWTNWWRNMPMGQVDRNLFAYAHFDISPSDFILQELHIFGFMLMSGYFVVLSLAEPDNSPASECSKTIANDTRNRFELWQIQSVLIAFAYLPWTIFFWRIVTVFGEERYFASAMCIHVIWAALWVVASRPAWRMYHHWYAHTVDFVIDHSPEEAEKYMLIEPVSRSMLAVSAVASTASFIYPLLQSAL